MTYKKIVDAVRVAARDLIRLQSAGNYTAERYELTLVSQQLTESLALVNKNIARNAYATSMVDPKNPDAEDLKKGYADELVELNKEVETVNKEIETNNKAIADIDAKLTDLQAGKILVSKEHLNRVTNELLAEFGKNAALKVAEAAAQDVQT